MAFTDSPWDGSASRWKDTPSYCEDCIINENTGPQSDWVQAKCHLPVKEPGSGDVNKNAVHNATARLMQTKMSPESKRKAARRLRSYYHQMKEDVPDVLKRMG